MRKLCALLGAIVIGLGLTFVTISNATGNIRVPCETPGPTTTPTQEPAPTPTPTATESCIPTQSTIPGPTDTQSPEPTVTTSNTPTATPKRTITTTTPTPTPKRTITPTPTPTIKDCKAYKTPYDEDLCGYEHMGDLNCNDLYNIDRPIRVLDSNHDPYVLDPDVDGFACKIKQSIQSSTNTSITETRTQLWGMLLSGFGLVTLGGIGIFWAWYRNRKSQELIGA